MKTVNIFLTAIACIAPIRSSGDWGSEDDFDQFDDLQSSLESGHGSDEDMSFLTGIVDKDLREELLRKNHLRRLRLSSTDSDALLFTDQLLDTMHNPRCALLVFVLGTYGIALVMIQVMDAQRYFLILTAAWCVMSAPLMIFCCCTWPRICGKVSAE